MSKIKVNSLPINEVITDLANELDLKYSINCKEYIMPIATEVGMGYVKGMMLESGMGIIEYSFRLNETLEIQFVKDEVHPLKFLYCLNGYVNHKFANHDDFNTLDQYQQAIIASKNNNGHILSFDKGVDITLYSLEMDRQKFTVLDDCSTPYLGKDIKKLIGDTKANEEFYHKGFFSLELADIFDDIRAYGDNYFLKRVFLLSGGYKILGKQIAQYEDDKNNGNNSNILRNNEVSKIKSATQYISDNIENSYTIKDISRAVGLNEIKLQSGFKMLYKTTVNQYISNKRLEIAAHLLRTTDLSISEIVYKVGLSSKSYFSKFFKDEYHATPTAYRKLKNKQD